MILSTIELVKNWRVGLLFGFGVLSVLVACQDLFPTVNEPGLVPVKVTTIEVTLSFDEFLSQVRTFPGFGHTSELGKGFVAHEFGEDLKASTLVRFARYPPSVSLVDSTGTTRPDSSLTFLSGELIVRIDAEASIHDGPVAIQVDLLSEDWHAGSATWEHAVDTVGGRTVWSEPGGGFTTPLGSGIWDPAEGDSIVIAVDSTQLRLWADTTDGGRGIRISTNQPGVRLAVPSPILILETLPSINTDTIIQLPVGAGLLNFIYDPLADPPPAGIRVGGAPAWRSVLDLTIPTELNGPPALCAAVGGCPVVLNPEVVSFAGLRLTTTAGPVAFTPSDTLSLDLRSVLAPSLLPKSPLGPTRTAIGGEILLPQWFGAEVGHVVEASVTSLVRDILRGETEDGDPVSTSLALLSSFEPLSLEFVTFEGGGAPQAPQLRLILTFSERVGG